VAGVVSTTQFEKYLGLIALIGRLKVATFSGLQGKNMGTHKWMERKILVASK
jgi:hypothetical protein